MTRKQAKEEIKSNIDCRTKLKKSKNGNYCCPFCGSGTGKNKTGALEYYPDTNTFYCFACNKSGDVIDLYQHETGKDYNETLSLLAESLNVTIDGQEEWIETAHKEEKQETPQADFTAYYKACRARLTEPAAVEYLQSRGISTATAAKYWVGFDAAADPASAPGAMGNEYKPHPTPRLIIPTNKAHYVGRRTDGGKSFEKINAKDSTPGIFNEKVLYTQEVHEVFVVEGAFDALSLMEIGENAIALNSAGNYDKLADIFYHNLDEIKAKALLLCPDNDADPKTAEKIRKQFEKLKFNIEQLYSFPVFIVDINGIYKDANEHLTKDRLSFKDTVQQVLQTVSDKDKNNGEKMVDSFLSMVQDETFQPIPTGIKSLDFALRGGFTRQTLVMLGAAPGMGKTALAQWIFENMAAAGNDVLYLNLEMSREQLLARSISRLAWKYEKADISALDVLRGYSWTDEQRQTIEKTVTRYKEDIAEYFTYNPKGIKNNISSILSVMKSEADRMKLLGSEAPLICIDYLQLIDTESKDAVEGMKNVIALLKDFAERYNTVVFVIMANNRTSNKAGAAEMESGRDTSAIEYSGDLMLGIVYTAIEDRVQYEAGETKKGETIYNTYDLDEIRRLKKEAYRNKAPLPDVCREITLKVNKNRFGEDGREARLVFDGAHSTFTTKEDADDIKQNPFIPGGAKQLKIM